MALQLQLLILNDKMICELDIPSYITATLVVD